MCDAVALRPNKSPGATSGTPRNLLLRTASWRSSPASEKQRQHLFNKVGEKLDSFLKLANGGKAIALEAIDKGLAGRAMTMLKHGRAKSRMEGHERTESRRIARAQKALVQKSRNEPLRVGPLKD